MHCYFFFNVAQQRFHLELLLTRQVHSKDDVQVLVARSVVSNKDMAGCGAIQTNISNRDSLLLKPCSHRYDDVTRTQLQRGKVSTAMDWNHLRKNLMKNLHLLSAQTVKPLTGFLFRHAVALNTGWRVTKRVCYDSS